MYSPPVTIETTWQDGITEVCVLRNGVYVGNMTGRQFNFQLFVQMSPENVSTEKADFQGGQVPAQSGESATQTFLTYPKLVQLVNNYYDFRRGVLPIGREVFY